MLGVGRWIQSRRRTGTVDGNGREHGLSELRTAAGGIGTTLDEPTTRAELARSAARLVAGVAAVVRGPGETVSGYEWVTGDAGILPDQRWAVAVARETGSPAADGGQTPWTGFPAGSGARPAIGVPLTTGELRYGVLVCARDGPPFTRTEAEILALLAERAASHIRHAREYERVNRTASDLQRALLAEPGRPHPNLEVGVRYLPAGGRTLVGGDWCETVRLHFGRTLLVVGDVMGHGLEAAVDMNAYRSSLRYIASADLPPHRVLRQMDDIAAGEADRRPATCLIARVDPARGQLTLASAGHLPPALITRDGVTTLLPAPVGPPLGTGFGGYESATYELDPDETLVLFTDGLVEHRGEDIESSLDRLARLRFTPAMAVGDILETIVSRLDARNAEDDVAVLAARSRLRRDAAPPEEPGR
ncbi:PP2C family protein-serine/threonine phosphatase [Streptomyces sp. NPDC058964]|uniref:PP2C family protein-serine/threonine phosphatase n=1 Tax=Streptomyces sp. NPDC058964 TaxID=3346681 RepID=UPI0036C246E0